MQKFYSSHANEGVVGLQKLEAQGYLPENNSLDVTSIIGNLGKVAKSRLSIICCKLCLNEDLESFVWLAEANYDLPYKKVVNLCITHSRILLLESLFINIKQLRDLLPTLILENSIPRIYLRTMKLSKISYEGYKETLIEFNTPLSVSEIIFSKVNDHRKSKSTVERVYSIAVLFMIDATCLEKMLSVIFYTLYSVESKQYTTISKVIGLENKCENLI